MAAEAGVSSDPFALQRDPNGPSFQQQIDQQTSNEAITDDPTGATLSPPLSPETARDRRQSREWDASKVLPSQFQKRKGSVYAVPASRDGHVDNHKSRDKAFHDKLKEKGWFGSSKS